MSDVNVSVGLDTKDSQKQSQNYINSLEDMIKASEEVQASNKKLSKSFKDDSVDGVNALAASIGKLGAAIEPYQKRLMALSKALSSKNLTKFAEASAKLQEQISKQEGTIEKVTKAQNKLKDADGALALKKRVLIERFREYQRETKAAVTETNKASKAQDAFNKSLLTNRLKIHNAEQKKLAKVQKEVEATAKKAAKAEEKFHKSLLTARLKQHTDQQKKLAKAQRETEKSAERAAKAQARLNERMRENAKTVLRSTGLWSELRGAVAAYVGINTVSKIIDINTAMVGMNSALISITGSQFKANQSMKFIKDTAQELGLDVMALADGYKQLTAASKGANFPFKQSDKVFKAVAKSARALNLSTEDVKGTIRALSQIMSKGSVQSEELKGQLGKDIAAS